MPVESQFKTEVKASLAKAYPDAYIQKMHGSQFQAGIPDLLAVIEGFPVMIELKAMRTLPKRAGAIAFKLEDVTPLQRHHLTAWSKAGGIGMVMVGVMRQGRQGKEVMVQCPWFWFRKGENNLQSLTVEEWQRWPLRFSWAGHGIWDLSEIFRFIGQQRT